MEEIISLRTSFLIDRVLTGLRMNFDEALNILRNHDEFRSESEKEERGLLIAAIDNLIDFAAAEENQMLSEIPREKPVENYAEYESVFNKYNLLYATEENQHVHYAATIAAWWLSVSSESLVTFMTQSDERVRPWHLSFEGLTYPKNEFPPELIPPIEWGCRCYLITNSFHPVFASLKSPEIKVNPVFKESLATGGKIFSEEHSYFRKQIKNEIVLISDRLKQKFFIS